MQLSVWPTKIEPRCGGCAYATDQAGWMQRCMTRREAVADRSFPPGVRHQIEHLAAHPPSEAGVALRHWSTRSLARAAATQTIVPAIHPTTVGRILRAARLRPHLWRYWKHTDWTQDAVQRALSILWVYERVEWLWHKGIVVLAVDEKPNLQVLERAAPTVSMLPGQVERQSFDYIRHGTVNMLVSLTLHTGHMGLVCLERNDGAHFRPALAHLIRPYAWARQVWLIMDNGPSHTSADSLAFYPSLVHDPRRVRVLFTPTGASWLNLAESLLEAFAERYLFRGDWASRPVMMRHLFAAKHEYNHLFAHPFAWHWTRHHFRIWRAHAPTLIRCKTSATAH